MDCCAGQPPRDEEPASPEEGTPPPTTEERADLAAQRAQEHVQQDAIEVARRESQALLNVTSIEEATQKEEHDGAAAAKAQAAETELAEALGQAKAKFAELDAEQSGKLEVGEMHEMSRWVFERRGMSEEERAAAYAKLEALDTNKDGSLDFGEFSAWFTSEAGAAQMKAAAAAAAAAQAEEEAAAAQRRKVSELKARGDELMAAGDHAEAAGHWQAARQLDPEDEELPVRIHSAKQKIEETATAAASAAAADVFAEEAARETEEAARQDAIDVADGERRVLLAAHAVEEAAHRVVVEGEAAAKAQAAETELAEALGQAKAKFAELDADQSGKLEVGEMHEMSRWVFERRGMSEEERAAAYAKLEALDTNKDGSLDFGEFSAWFTSEAGAAQMKAAAAAAAQAEEEEAAAQRRKVSELKARGDEQAAAGDHTQAVASWQAALLLSPEDEEVLGKIDEGLEAIEAAGRAQAELAAQKRMEEVEIARILTAEAEAVPPAPAPAPAPASGDAHPNMGEKDWREIDFAASRSVIDVPGGYGGPPGCGACIGCHYETGCVEAR